MCYCTTLEENLMILGSFLRMSFILTNPYYCVEEDITLCVKGFQTCLINFKCLPKSWDKFEIGKTCPIKILIVDKMVANDIWNVRTNVQLFKEDGMCFNLFTRQKVFKVAYILAYVPSPLLPPKLFLIIALYYYLYSRLIIHNPMWLSATLLT